MGTKNNPGKFDCYEHAEPDEPMFILLARDRSAPRLVDDWADNREWLVMDGRRPQEDMEKVEEARKLADAMRTWRKEHQPNTKS